jgi:hypothetical protein
MQIKQGRSILAEFFLTCLAGIIYDQKVKNNLVF